MTATPSTATPAINATCTVALRYTGGSGSKTGCWISHSVADDPADDSAAAVERAYHPVVAQ